MNIDHMIEQMPEYGIVKKNEVRTVHVKDEHLLTSSKEGDTIDCIMYIDKNGHHWKVADIVYYHNLNKLIDKATKLNIELNSNQMVVA